MIYFCWKLNGMILNLIEDDFLLSDAKLIITQFIHMSIKHHENKLIDNFADTEQVKFREQRIVELHKCLYDSLEQISKKDDQIHLKAQIMIA